MSRRLAIHGRRGQGGMALLVVMVILLAVGSSSASFIWFMNQQQARAGARYRAAAAMAAAEAGVHRALSVLEGAAPPPDGWAADGRTWRPASYTERIVVGRLEGRYVVTLADAEGGAILVTSVGQIGSVSRRLRARVFLPSPTLLAAICGTSVIRIEKAPATIVVLPYGHLGDRPWIQIAAGRAIWFGGTDVAVNDPAISVAAGPGPVDGPGLPAAAPLESPAPVRIMLARDADLLIGANRQRAEVEQLRAGSIYIDRVVQREDALPPIPTVDAAFYQSLAAANTRNAALHEAAGGYLGDADLARKRDSLYAPAEFQRILTYLKSGETAPVLQGVIYVSGGAAIGDGQRLQIADGALVTEGTVILGPGAGLEVTHSASTRGLPGVLVARSGALVISQGARLRAHGLVYADRVIDIGEGAHVDIVGAIASADRGLSIRAAAATLIVRYDPAVLGTPGLQIAADAPVVAWVALWEELP